MQDFEVGLFDLGSASLWIEFSDVLTSAGKSYILFSLWLIFSICFHYEYRQQTIVVLAGPWLLPIKSMAIFLSPKSCCVFHVFWNIYSQHCFEITIFIKPSTRLTVLTKKHLHPRRYLQNPEISWWEWEIGGGVLYSSSWLIHLWKPVLTPLDWTSYFPIFSKPVTPEPSPCQGQTLCQFPTLPVHLLGSYFASH